MPENKNLFFQLTKNTENTETPFILKPDGTLFLYKDMINLTGSYANTLRKLNIQQNDRVVVQTEKKLECLWLYLACLRVGAIYITINPDYTVSETEYFIKDAKPKLFITTDLNNNMRLRELSKSLENVIVMDLQKHGDHSFSLNASKEKHEYKTAYSNGDDIAAILYTSGTTGKAKGAMISHHNLFSNARSLSIIWDISSTDILLHILPIYHTHGLFVAFNSMIYSGGAILFHEKFVVNDVIEAIPNVTMLMGVPTHYSRLIAEKSFSANVTKSMRLFISGSAPLSSEVHAAFKKITKLEILERYGMTETNMITSNPYKGRRVPGTVGFPLPDVNVRIRDIKTGKLIINNFVGIIEVNGPNVFSGYWQMEERNKIDFTDDGFFITGDLGFFDSGGYLNISGRDKDLIISGGLNIYPAEVEQVLESFPEISEAALIGVPHPDFGEGVTAVITLSDKGTKPNEKDLRNRLRTQLASFKVPLKIQVKDDLPKNAMGKIQKNLLRKEFKHIYLKDI